MKPVNYDSIAPGYGRRYDGERYDGVSTCLQRFLHGARGVAEVGCGTGHWLREVSQSARGRLIGIDLSWGMLERARVNAPRAMLVRGTADRLPWADSSLDRVFCVNALHHFPAPMAFLAECHRVLRPGGGVLTIGLDPHRGDDQWWVYDFFPSALAADRARYPSTAAIRHWLDAVGFSSVSCEVAQRISTAVPFETARDGGFLDRGSTSQFMVISDGDFESGMSRLLATRPMLHAALELHASIGLR